MLVYGREERIAISLKFLSLELAHQLELIEGDAMTSRIVELMKLEEIRQQAMQTLQTHQQQIKKRFDIKDKARFFKECDLMLKWDAEREKLERHSKFDAIWGGPYVIINCK